MLRLFQFVFFLWAIVGGGLNENDLEQLGLNKNGLDSQLGLNKNVPDLQNDVGGGYVSQLGLNENDLDLQKFAQENNIKLHATQDNEPTTETQSDNEPITESQSAARAPIEGDGAGPIAARVGQPETGAIHVVAITHVVPGGIDGGCCKDAMPECMACSYGISVEVYCQDNPVVGCPSVSTEKMKKSPREKEDHRTRDVKNPPPPEPRTKPEELRQCTIKIAENNQGCPTGKCASPDAVRAKCLGKDWKLVKEIEDPASCCLKPCNFQCLQPKEPSHGTQNLVNTNALQPKQMPNENEMKHLDYDKNSKKVFKPVPKSADKPKEPKKPETRSQTVYVRKQSERSDEKQEKTDNKAEKPDVKEKTPEVKEEPKETKQKVVQDPSAKLQLFDSTVTSDSFTFSYEIANANPNGGYYWTVQRKESGSLLASAVEKDGESAACSGFGEQGEETKVVNVKVQCKFAQGKTYLLWFALDQDKEGNGVFLSPSEPVAVDIPVEKRTFGDAASTTMSAYGYALMLNGGEKTSPMTKIINGEKSEDSEPKEKESDDSEDKAQITHIFHVVHVQKDSQPEETEEDTPQSKDAPKVVFQILKKSGDSEKKEPEKKEDDDDDDDSSKEKLNEEKKAEIKNDVKEAVKQAKTNLKTGTKKVLKKEVEKAKQTVKDAKKVLKDAKTTKKKMKEKVEKIDDDDDDDEKKDSLKENVEKAEKAQRLKKAVDNTSKAQKAHAKAKKAVENTKKRIKKLEGDIKREVKKSKETVPSDMEEDDDEEKAEDKPKSQGKYKIGALTSKSLTVSCKNCPKQKKGKLYYLMMHHHHKTKNGGHVVTAVQVFHAFLGGKDKPKDSEQAVSGGIDLNKAQEFNIEHEIDGESYILYLAVDADGKGKDLRLIGEGLAVNKPEHELSLEFTNTLNKWRQTFFVFFCLLVSGAILLLYRHFCPSKRDYQQLLLDFDVYEDEF